MSAPPAVVRDARTVVEMFVRRVELTPDMEAFRYPVGKGWGSLSWRETAARVRAIACGLRALGLADEERCAIISSTRLEWILCDLAVVCAGGATTAIYPSTTADECTYIVADSGSAYAFVEDASQLAKLREQPGAVPRLRKAILLDGSPDGDADAMTLADLEALGRAEVAARPERFGEVASRVRPDGLATLVYTSGTTGRPKGVELIHENWVAQAEAVDRARILDHADPLQLFWLPLSHVFGKMIGTAQLRLGFPTAVDGRIERILDNLATVRPTFMCAVPRVFEKVYNRILAQARHGSAARQAIFRWALAIGRERARAEREGRRIGPGLALGWAVADRLVFRRIRAIFGGRLQFFISGSAPLSREVNELFSAAGLLILEGYGLTETAAATHVNLPTQPRPGTVGPALPGIEVRIADDGEVLMRGPWIMRGYHDRPEATAESLEGGWLHTGDVGSVDAEGRLTISDRKKDLIKTSGGKFVAPQELEGRLKALCPLVSQVMVYGDSRPYVSALVTLEPQALSAWAEESRAPASTPDRLAGDAALRAEIRRAIDAMNATLPPFAVVKRFTVLPADFSEAAGELTPSQKLKRRVVEERYRALLDGMYSERTRRLANS